MVDAVGDGGEGHHALVQEAWLIVFDGLAVWSDALVALAALAAFGERGADVLGVFVDLADGFGAEARGAFGEGVDFADAGVRGWGEGHGFGVWFCLLGEVVGLRREGFGDEGGGCDDEAGGHGCFAYEG